jgi:hypothetical protein
VLAVLHRESHLARKPDEIARSRAARLYREKHPAANHAAAIASSTRRRRRNSATPSCARHLPEEP